MVWGAFGYKRKLPLTEIPSEMNSAVYQDLLQNSLIPHGRKIWGPKYIFQQDNAPCHASKSTISWLKNKKIKTINWPPRSPDLNPTENLWADLSRRVYGNGRQFSTIASLRRSIFEAWEEIETTRLETLIERQSTFRGFK
jgi:hypothetical protein